jgi:hypothetical protein
MAVEEVQNTVSHEALLAALAEPFDPSEIKWRVTHTTQDGRRGAVVAFADPRAYTDRLNHVFTPTGWTRTYNVTTISAVSRQKRDKLIQTGKVLVTCTVTIHGLGCHSGSGEEWADEQNAMTSAEAQAFKRACTCFCLGRYLYKFAEMWVPLNEHRQPLEYPSLPRWALPGKVTDKGQTLASERTAAAPRGPIDQDLTATIENFPRVLGTSIYGELLWRISRVKRAADIPNAQLQASVVEAGNRAARGIRKASALADAIGDAQFIKALDDLQISSMATIPNLEALKRLVFELEGCASKLAA